MTIREVLLAKRDDILVTSPITIARRLRRLRSPKEALEEYRPMAYAFAYSRVLDTGGHMTSLTATEACKRLYALLDAVADPHEPIQIAGKRHSAVLVSESDWRAIQETLYLASIPGMRASIRRGLKTPVEKCHAEPGW